MPRVYRLARGGLVFRNGFVILSLTMYIGCAGVSGRHEINAHTQTLYLTEPTIVLTDLSGQHRTHHRRNNTRPLKIFYTHSD
jgi:hypothetical protein